MGVRRGLLGHPRPRSREILLGALLAVVLARAHRAGRHGLARSRRPLLALGVCVVLFPASAAPPTRAGCRVVAVGSTALVLGLQAPGPVQRALSLRPLVWLGGISYGVYLYHWPIYVLLDEQRTGLGRPALVPLQLAVTLVVAQLSYTFVEQPVRRAKGLPFRVTIGGGALATAVVVVLALTVVPKPLGEYYLPDDATVEAVAIDVGAGADEPLTSLTGTVPSSSTPSSTAPAGTVPPSLAPVTTAPPASTAPPSTTEPPLPPLARPVRIVVAGDSTACATGTGLLYWAAANPDLAQVEVVGAPGCGFLLGGERREGGFKPAPDGCDLWLEQELPQRVAELQPDVVMMMVTSWDVVDHRWDDGIELTPLDASFEQRLATDYAAITDELLGLGAGSIAWVKPPIPNILWQDQGTGQEDPGASRSDRSCDGRHRRRAVPPMSVWSTWRRG